MIGRYENNSIDQHPKTFYTYIIKCVMTTYFIDTNELSECTGQVARQFPDMNLGCTHKRLRTAELRRLTISKANGAGRQDAS